MLKILSLVIISAFFIGNLEAIQSNSECKIDLVESIPQNLTYNQSWPVFRANLSTTSWWKKLIVSTRNRLRIASFYWTLLPEDISVRDASSKNGLEIFHLLKGLSNLSRLQIIQNGAKQSIHDLSILEQAGAKLAWLDVKRLMGGVGILHTKLWLADNETAYLGSANMDWRSLTQVKELGVAISGCPALSADLSKVMDVYDLLSGVNSSVPVRKWPARLTTHINMNTPLRILVNSVLMDVFIASSPPEFNPPGRTNDLNSLLSTIHRAQKFIYISVMDFSSLIVYYGARSNRFWPDIQNALLERAINDQVEVRLLISIWSHTSHDVIKSLLSIICMNGIEHSRISAKLFRVPAFTEAQARIPFARVNHAKYMVTDEAAYIGTSNWSGDYFLNTGGVSLTAREVEKKSENRARPSGSLRWQTEMLFLRDWNSSYANKFSCEN